MPTTIDGSASATFNTPLPIAQGGTNVSVVPAFSAYQSTAQSIPNGTYTKIQYQTKEFDITSAYDAVTNYRFQPLVTGYYQINAAVYFTTGAASTLLTIFRNNIEYRRGCQSGGVAGSGQLATVASLIFFNGTTDYIEMQGFQASGTTNTTGAGGLLTYFQAFLARAA